MIHSEDLTRIERELRAESARHYERQARQAMSDNGSFDGCSLRSKALTFAYLTLGAWAILGVVGFTVWAMFGGAA